MMVQIKFRHSLSTAKKYAGWPLTGNISYVSSWPVLFKLVGLDCRRSAASRANYEFVAKENPRLRGHHNF